MKESYKGRKLDRDYCIRRMSDFERIAYDFIYKDTEFKQSDGSSKILFTDWCNTIDKFIETAINADTIIREHLYYPNRGDLV